MTTTGRTRAELAAWLDRWNENGAAPSADSVVDFLGIELAPDPEPPVGQRRRSPGGVEVVKTDDGMTDPWRRYRGPGPAWRSDVEVADPGPAWFTDNEVADWEVITDAPDCDREHLPEGHVPITFNGWSDDDLKAAARVVGSGGLGAAIRAELTNRGEGHASVTAVWSTELDLSPDAN